tara:strand:+ start:402 stop:596 length:195 start_codon:yes stop_codon:yes gene_type:complete
MERTLTIMVTEMVAFSTLAPHPVVFVVIAGPLFLYLRWMAVFSNPRNTPARLRIVGYLSKHPLT